METKTDTLGVRLTIELPNPERGSDKHSSVFTITLFAQRAVVTSKNELEIYTPQVNGSKDDCLAVTFEPGTWVRCRFDGDEEWLMPLVDA